MKKIMFISPHQDDMQDAAGGLLAKLRKHIEYEGLEVCLTDGSVGHYESKYLKNPQILSKRRVNEATQAASVLGFDYKLLTDSKGKNFKDGDLEVNRATKGAVWAAIRDFQPDLLFSPPVNNIHDPFGMHNDHTNVGEIVKRVAYLISAPLAFPEFYPEGYIENLSDDEALPYINPPIIVTTHDPYSGQIEPDLIIEISDVIDKKVEAWSKHVSEWKEWLPWVGRYDVPESPEELKQSLIDRSNRLAKNMGVEAGLYESFTITKWALRVPTIEEIKTYFPGDIFNYELAEEKIKELSS